jgi:signal transduction histidine kinase
MNVWCASVALPVCLGAVWPAAAAARERPREVVVLYSDRVFNVDAVLDARLQAAPGGARLMTENLDLARLEDADYTSRLAELLRRKYEARHVDLVIPVAQAALRFLAEKGDQAFPGVPVVFSTIDSERLRTLRLPPFIAGRAGRVVALATAQAALALQPETRRIVLVTGESVLDRYWRQRVRRELKVLEGRVEIDTPAGLTLPDLLDRLRALPDHSIVLFLAFREDAAGSTYGSDAVPLVAQASRVPVYVAYEEALGSGVVGGFTFSYEREAEKAAALALRVLRGERPQDVGVRDAETNAYVFDWRQLRRWRIPESRLPAGSIVRFRPASPWSLYRRQILAGLGVLLLQTLLLIGLFVQARRRLHAERELDERLRFETLFSEITRRLTHAEAARLDQEIEAALRRLAEALAVDRADVGEFVAGSGELAIRFTYVASSRYRELPPVIDAGEPWVSSIQVPLSSGGAPLGGLGLGLLVQRTWPDALVARLELCGEIFGNALMRRRLERLLEESRGLGISLFGSLYGQVAVVDRRGMVVAVNDSWAQAARGPEPWGPGTPLGANYLDACRTARDRGQPDAEAVLQGLAAVLENSAPTFSTEYRSLEAGAERWLHLLAEPLRRADGGAVITLVDVTDRKRAELEAGRLRGELAHVSRISTLGELAASLAHELNQPLAAILSNAQAARIIMGRPAPDLDEVREILAEVIEDDERAGQVIKRLRTLYRNGQGECVQLDMNDLIREVLRLLENDVLLRGAALRVDLAGGLPLVEGDRIQLQQVMLNLMVNGLDAMRDQPSGQRNLSVRSALREAHMLIEVADTGRGVPEADRERLFEPFFTTKPAGMGMGLAIARSIVEAHGGDLSLVSPPGVGAVFRVTIPARS